jgi:3-hydroxybutyryl-CoA dehydrogenase
MRVARLFERVGVIGLGTMGAGIAEVLSRAGIHVVGVEGNEAGLTRAREHLQHSTDRALTRGKLTADEQSALLGRIALSSDIASVADCELVLEAVPERFDVKIPILQELDRICGPDTILATNTSALSVTELAVATSRPDRVVGLHWFNPAPVMGLVEVVRTVVANDQVIADVTDLAIQCGKRPVAAADRAGFIANALLFGYLNNALRMYESKYATREDIDAAMRFGTGHPMGPLALLDLIGLDSAYEILDTMYHQSRDHLHAPAPLLKQLVTAGLLGRKTGRGLYSYEAPDSSVVTSAPEAAPVAEGTARAVSKIGVVGTGTMATGIVEVTALAGYEVIYRARSEEKVAAVRKKLEASFDKQVQRNRITEEARAAALARVTGTVELDALSDVDLVIEAVVEELSVKRALFAALDEVCKPGAVLATTTSSLAVIECAQATTRPGDVIGMHWFNPAPAMKLIEIIPTVATHPDVVATIRAVSEKSRKHPVVCGDRAGFIVNALLFPYLNDAAKMLEAHYATTEDMDTAMTVGCGHPMGPFALLDVVGLDVSLAIEQALYLEFREPGFAPAPMLEHLVTAGYLGRKTGRGFRDYTRR